MSDTSDNENKVTCSAEDCENVRQYSKHFNVPLTDGLIAALDVFEKEPTFENQNMMKLEVAKWMTTSPHESFQDSLWDGPKKAADDAIFELQFDKDLKEHLSDEEKAEQAQKSEES